MDDAPRHFSGVTSAFVIEYLRTRMSEDEIAALLTRAGERRTADELADGSSWSSYGQLRTFLETVVDELGESARLSDVGRAGSLLMPEFSAMLQAFGSPAELYRALGELSAHFSPVIDVVTHEVNATEWLCEFRFKAPFEPFKAYCEYSCGLLGIVATVFAFPLAEAVEECCQVDGAECCRFRVRWDATDSEGRRADYLQRQVDLYTARLAILNATVAELVSDAGVDQVLTRILSSAARAVNAPAHLLVLEDFSMASRNVYAEGLTADEAERFAIEVRRHDTTDAARLVADVTSRTRRYGRLAALHTADGRFLPDEQATLDTYAQLAAAALDSAAALEEARRQAATARTLLELSTDLSEIASIDEVAAKLVLSVPAIVDCDRAIIVLLDPETSLAHVAATFGYDEEADISLRAARFAVHLEGDASDPVSAAASDGVPFDLDAASKRFGAVAAASARIIGNGQLLGWVAASVTQTPERLDADPQVEERLRGLAALASTAINNAHLMQEVRHQALHDTLTSLPNRALILDRVEQLLARARRHRTVPSALFVDLDGFKDVNDTLGHAMGDELLRAVGRRLEKSLRASDTIGRLGGDEFVVLAEVDTLGVGPEDAAERLLTTLREPFHLGDQVVTVTASIGIAIGDRETPGELLRDADIALYRAKAEGRNRHVLYAPEMHAALRDRAQIEVDLRGALDRDEFFLVYQPICNLRSGVVTGVEALLRWRHPTRGVVQPNAFIPILEESGSIIEIGRWVLTEACRAAALWRARGHELQISVNVSGRQLEHAALSDHVRDALAQSGLEPEALVLEITETVAMRDLARSAAALQSLKDLGLRIAIDDFGTGYSSLAHLREFPVDTLKIDQSFIDGVNESSDADALLHMLVSLGKTLGLETVAEGIEQHAQYAHLQRQDCDRGQGFLIARPLDAGAVEPFLAQTAELRRARDAS